MTESLIYVATPYSHHSKEMRALRYIWAVRCITELHLQGKYPYSPIAHWHQAATEFGLAKDHNYWLSYDRLMMRLSSEIYVATLPGWQESKGIQSDVDYAKAIGKKVTYWEPDFVRNSNERRS